MHIQSKSWFKLSLKERDKKLLDIGVNLNLIRKIRSLSPKQKILESTKIALKFDPVPSHDFIECIAGYKSRGGIYNHFKNLQDLINSVPKVKHKNLEPVNVNRHQHDVSKLIPTEIDNTRIWIEYDKNNKEKLVVWQKTNGRMRCTTLNRIVNKTIFLLGIALYAGEGTKYSENAKKVEIVNSNPSIIASFIKFLENLGIEKSKLKARVHIYNAIDELTAEKFWILKLGLKHKQFTKPLIKHSERKNVLREVSVIDINLSNSMLNNLLKYWTDNLEELAEKIQHSSN